MVEALRAGLAELGLPVDAISLVKDPSHEAAIEFMRLRGLIDVLVPRGGPSLIASMLEHATVPVVLDGDGNCHVYVDAAADLDMAVAVVVNAKTQRPGVCNAMESLLLHEDVAGSDAGPPWRGHARRGFSGDAAARRAHHGGTCHRGRLRHPSSLDLIATVAVARPRRGHRPRIARYGSGHSEAIITADMAAAARFLADVDAAAVLHNASTLLRRRLS